MVSFESVRQLALSFPETEEQPHFHLVSFRVKKKIFCTIYEKDKRIMVKLTPIDQSVFCAFDCNIIYPVPGGWGKKGAIFIELSKLKMTMLKDALRVAYCTTAPPKLAREFMSK